MGRSRRLALAEEGLGIAERVHHPFSMIEACRVVSVLYLRQGTQRAIPVLERAMALCQEWFRSYGLRRRRPWVWRMPWQGVALRGCSPGGTRYGARDHQWESEESDAGTHLSEAYLVAGRLEEARQRAVQVELACQYQQRLAGLTAVAPGREPGVPGVLNRRDGPGVTTARPSSWPRSWGCVRCSRTATGASVPSRRRWSSGAGPCGTLDRHRPIPHDGHGLLVTPNGGSPGAGGEIPDVYNIPQLQFAQECHGFKSRMMFSSGA